MILIDKNKVLEKIARLKRTDVYRYNPQPCSMVFEWTKRDIYTIVHNAQEYTQADAERIQRMKHGHWMNSDEAMKYGINWLARDPYPVCSVCRTHVRKQYIQKLFSNFQYCPDCGAVMDGNEDDTD